jgi:sulfur carrier protein ThiS
MSVLEEPVVTLSTFGDGRRLSCLSRRPMTVEDVLREHGVHPEGRRVAVNGHTAGLDRVVQDRDQVSVVPRVQGG